jgi:hypothetical protein
MVVIAKTKSQLRAESEAQLAAFKRAGGVVQVSEYKSRARKQVMRGKSTRPATTGTSGFATGYPRKTTIATL